MNVVIEKSFELENNEDVILFILNKLNINCTNIEDINGQIIERNLLLDHNKYLQIKNYNYQLKKILNSSDFTCVHNNAPLIQKYPLINLLRQLLKKHNFKLIPFKKADGYTIDKIKKYKRFFKIQKELCN